MLKSAARLCKSLGTLEKNYRAEIMATETELKLQLHAADLERLRIHPLLQAAEAGGVKTLLNTYYDSPELLLAQSRVAVRLRYQGDRIIQTLKTSGQSVNGLHQRGEWEWDLQQAELDTGLLSGEGWPASLPSAGELDWVAVFTTNFEREIWLLSYQGAEIEVALDQGLIRCDCPEGGHLEDEILELELELKSGEAEALLALAEDLGQTLSLQPFDLSKAQRGYQLFRQCCSSH
jgi:inorganic triphosphatase YgiF